MKTLTYDYLRSALDAAEYVSQKIKDVKVQEVTKSYFLRILEEYLTQEGFSPELKKVSSVEIIENDVVQEGLENHFKSNQTKAEFTVNKVAFLNGKLVLDITTKKKRW